MTPGKTAATVSALLFILSIAAAAWFEPSILRAWYYLFPVALVLWVFAAVALGVPVVALLRLARRSRIAYVAILVAIGAGVGGGIGAIENVPLAGAVVGALVYGVTASIVVWQGHDS